MSLYDGWIDASYHAEKIQQHEKAMEDLAYKALGDCKPKAVPIQKLAPLPELKVSKPFNLDGWEELDTECYKDYWLAKFYRPDGTCVEFAQWPGKPLDVQGLGNYLSSIKGVITFNGAGYDDPMVAAALQGFDCQTLKNLSDAIIVGGVRYWEFYRQFNVPEPWWSRIDIMEVAPGVRISLKGYGGRMHAPQLQDLPIDQGASISMMDRLGLSTYCGNDLATTRLLKQQVMGRLRLRHEVGEQYNINVMSKSDAQIAEAVYKAKLPFKPQKTFLPHGHTFRYEAPPWISFVSAELKDLLAMVQRVDLVVNDPSQLRVKEEDKVYDSDGVEIKSGIQMPAEIKGRNIIIGQTTYRLGIGGLHSQEHSVCYKAVEGKWSISDHDVASYYPTLMLLMQMFPRGTGPEFMPILREIYDTRLDAKHKASACKKAGDDAGAKYWKTVADGLKIVLNGTYGKLGSRYSFLFAPELMIRTTLSGQLALLMLIEMLELNGIRVISANTDGIVLITPARLEWLRASVVSWWEKATGLETEQTDYSAIYSRDVNNYVAFKPDGTHKAKGVFGESGVSPDASPSGKHPNKDVCNDAVVAFLRDGTPVEQTIMACKDIRRFLVIRNVAGGALDGQGAYLGKMVRWYYGRGVTTCLTYKSNGNKVGSSDGAVPMMRLAELFPLDVDYDHYVTEAKKMLTELGVRQ